MTKEADDGWITLELEPIVVPWRTSMADLYPISDEVRSLYAVFFGREHDGITRQPQLALDRLQEIAKEIEEKYAEELAQAAEWHAAAGQATPITEPQGWPGFEVTWPIEDKLNSIRHLHEGWTEVAMERFPELLRQNEDV